MHVWEDALFEIRRENNRTMRYRAQELFLCICIQFAQDNGRDLSIKKYDNVFVDPLFYHLSTFHIR